MGVFHDLGDEAVLTTSIRISCSPFSRPSSRTISITATVTSSPGATCSALSLSTSSCTNRLLSPSRISTKCMGPPVLSLGRVRSGPLRLATSDSLLPFLAYLIGRKGYSSRHAEMSDSKMAGRQLIQHNEGIPTAAARTDSDETMRDSMSRPTAMRQKEAPIVQAV